MAISKLVDLSPALLDITFTAGDDALIPFEFGTTSGGVFTPFELTDWEPKVEIRHPKTGAVIDTLTIGNGKIYLVSDDTKMTHWVKAEVTESLILTKCTQLLYDLQIIVNDKKRTYTSGKIILTDQVTTG